MINKIHYIELIVNGNVVELLNQNDLNIRLNNVINDLTTTSTKQAEYSFSFEIPTTQNNNKIFNYANVIEKTNKFNRWDCEVYSDGFLIFNGDLTIDSISKDSYSCNLVSKKVNNLDTIFGDLKLTDIKDFYLDIFDGAATINEINSSNTNNDVYFPLVSYGVFQKTPIGVYNSYNEYTSRFDIDYTNKWYVETFIPSHNLLTTVKKCFNTVNYDISGDIFDDEIIKNVYLSSNIANEQDPMYNVGNPKFGKVELSVNWNNTSREGITQTLQYPYFSAGSSTDEYNFSDIMVYNLIDNDSLVSVSDTYMFDKGENLIVIPSDGLYKISLSTDIVSQGGVITNITEMHKTIVDGEASTETVTKNISQNLMIHTPFEVQVVRNYDNDIELIKGVDNFEYRNGDSDGTVTTWYTAYPHEKLSNAKNPTVKIDGGTPKTLKRGGTKSDQGYMPQIIDLFLYDPLINPNFICGLSTFGLGVPSVIKNGYSWSPLQSTKIESMYNGMGYYNPQLLRDGTLNWGERTTYNQNTLVGAPVPMMIGDGLGNQCDGTVSCIVKLNKNDVISLMGVTRAFTKDDDEGTYVSGKFSLTASLMIEAWSPKTVQYEQTQGNGWNTPTMFDTRLNLSNFLNKETKMYDFVNNFIKSFNLSVRQDGNSFILNKQDYNFDKMGYAVDIDDRVSASEAKSERIEYPSELAVKYKINTEEYGFELTVPQDKLDLTDWYNYGDSGFTTITIDDFSTENDETISIDTSYTYYGNFNLVSGNTSDCITSISVSTSNNTIEEGGATTINVDVVSDNGCGSFNLYKDGTQWGDTRDGSQQITITYNDLGGASSSTFCAISNVDASKSSCITLYQSGSAPTECSVVSVNAVANRTDVGYGDVASIAVTVQASSSECTRFNIYRNLELWREGLQGGQTISIGYDDIDGFNSTFCFASAVDESISTCITLNKTASRTIQSRATETKQISIPIISNYSYMIEGTDYDEAMSVDGRGLTQRLWFKQNVSEDYGVLTNSEKIYFSYPINYYNGLNLSYKDSEKSLLTTYFNINPNLSSNYIEVECYITPKEYLELKNGAMVHFNSDLYIVSEIQGFDPSNNNMTTLKLVKK